MVMPPLLIETPRPFFDYHAKYEDESTSYRFDSDWSLRDLDQLQDTALAACRALGTCGLVRVDIRTDASRMPWVLEVNTIPGLTVRSMVPKAAAQMGIDFAELCERAILSACRTQPSRPHHLQNRTVRPMFQPDIRNSGR
jgi:D-alanine-D-alanine ligase